NCARVSHFFEQNAWPSCARLVPFRNWELHHRHTAVEVAALLFGCMLVSRWKASIGQLAPEGNLQNYGLRTGYCAFCHILERSLPSSWSISPSSVILSEEVLSEAKDLLFCHPELNEGPAFLSS